VTGLTSDHNDRILVGLAIEAVLIEMGEPVYEKVTEILWKLYKCHTIDCYDHPEYLTRTLRDLYGESSVAIIDSIKKQLEKFSSRQLVNSFLTLITE
jgi:hypothetical protein